MLLIGVTKYESISTPLLRKDYQRHGLYYGSVFLGAGDVMVTLNYFKRDSNTALQFLRYTPSIVGEVDLLMPCS